MSQGDSSSSSEARLRTRNESEGGKNCDHAHDGMAVARKSLDCLDLSEFKQAQVPRAIQAATHWRVTLI
jgi:hypothetical protein